MAIAKFPGGAFALGPQNEVGACRFLRRLFCLLFTPASHFSKLSDHFLIAVRLVLYSAKPPVGFFRHP